MVGNRAQSFENGLIAARVWAILAIQAGSTMNKAVAPQIIQRIRAEYLEMPGLSLSAAQVQRLCGVDSALCESVLEALVESGFLARRSDGAYGRYRSTDVSHARQAKATLQPSVLAVAARDRRHAS
jgi:hypothetical protein